MAVKTILKAPLSGLLGILVAVSLFSAPATAQGDGGLKIAVIDVQKILTESMQGREVLAALEKVRSEKATQLEAKRKELDEAQSRYQQTRLTLAEDKIAEMEKDIEDMAIALRRLQDDAERELRKRQQEDFQRIEGEVMPIINALGQEFGYSLIFNKFQSGLVYADETVDVTDLVIERFNAASASSGN